MLQILTSSLAIIGVNLALYYRTLKYGYVSDDIKAFKREKIKPKNIFHAIYIQYIGMCYLTSGRYNHLMSLVTHVTTCLMIYFTFGMNTISLIGALLFSANPVGIQASVWLSGRPYCFAALLSILMFAIPILSPIFYGVGGMIFSYNILLSPLMFLFTKWWYLALLVPIAFWFGRNKIKDLVSKRAEVQSNEELMAIKPIKIIPIIKSYGYYLALCLIPFRIALYHPLLSTFGVDEGGIKEGYKIDKTFWFGILCLVLTGLGIYYCDGMVRWGLLWFVINIFPWCNLITLHQAIADRYTYLANIGLMLCLSELLLVHVIPPYGFYLVVAFFIFYAARLAYTLPMYLNEYWFSEYNVLEAKDLHTPWNIRGINRFMLQSYSDALFNFFQARAIRKNDFKINYNIAVLFLVMGRLEEAKKFYNITQHCKVLGRDKEMAEFLTLLSDSIKDIDRQLAQGKRATLKTDNLKLLR